MFTHSRRDLVFIILAGFFITNAIVAEMIGGKLIHIGPFAMSIGIIPWPVVFLTTDLINEYFGKSGVRKLTFLTGILISYAFILLFMGMNVEAADNSPVQDREFNLVFGQSLWIIVGSLVAFVTSQMVDVFVFWFFREKTGGKMIWLRSTGSTIISQLVDSFVVLGIAFLLPGKITVAEFFNLALTNYTFKLIIAVCLTPLIYVGHAAVDRYLGKSESHNIIQHTAEESLHHKVED